MADIKTYLEAILKAVYGEEVRGSIHDAIEAINNNVLDNREEVKGYATDAKNSANAAESSANQAASSASNSASYAANAQNSASDSASYASQAASSASDSASYASNADSYATRAQSWAVGGTSSRDGEDTNNAKYYSDQAQRAAAGVSGALSAQGTITFEQLSSVNPNVGWMYNISNDFITDSRFAEGSGVPYKAGTNVYWTANSQWDCLAAGSVEITPENFTGVLPVEKGGTGNSIGQAVSLPNWQLKKITVAELNSIDLTGGVYSIEGEELISGVGTCYYVIRISGYTYDVHSYYRDIALPYSFGIQYPKNAIYTRFWSDTTPGEWFRISAAAEIPTKTSELQNDSDFITSNDIPEGAAASTTVPKAPEATGSVGNELAFARGDHVHPFSNEELVPRGIIRSKEVLDTTLVPGSYLIDGAIIQEGVYAWGNLIVVRGTVDPYDTNSCTQIYIPHLTNKLYIRVYWNREWSALRTFEPATAENFEGLLPAEKGGTGNDKGFAQAVQTNMGIDTKEALEDIHSFPVGLSVSHIKAVISPYNSDGYILTLRYTEVSLSGTQIFLEDGYKYDTGLMLIRCTIEPNTWSSWFQIATTASIPSIATTSTAGLVKPGTGLEVTSDGTLNVTGGGSSVGNYAHISYVHIAIESDYQNYGIQIIGYKSDGTRAAKVYTHSQLLSISGTGGISSGTSSSAPGIYNNSVYVEASDSTNMALDIYECYTSTVAPSEPMPAGNLAAIVNMLGKNNLTNLLASGVFLCN